MLSAVGGAVAVVVAWLVVARRQAREAAQFVVVAKRALKDSIHWPPADRWPRPLRPLRDSVLEFRDHHHGVERDLGAAVVEAERQQARVLEMLDRVTDGFIAFDREWRFTYLNPVASKLLGKSLEELVGKVAWDEFPTAVGKPIEQGFLEAMRTQRPMVIETHYAPDDRWFVDHLYPSPEGLSMFFDEVTEQRHAARQVEDTRLRLELAIEASRIGIWDWDLTTDHLWIQFSRPRRAIDPSPSYSGPVNGWLQRIHPDDLQRFAAARDRHIADRTPSFDIEFRTLEVDQLWHWTFASAAVVRDGDDRPRRLLGMHMDITERRGMEDELLRSREELRLLARAQERAREAERTRVAREIHDELGQALAVIAMDLSWSASHLDAPSAERAVRLEAAQRVIAATTTAVRRIAAELRPGVLDDLGLAAAARWQCRELRQRGGLVVHDKIGVLPRLEQEAATAVFRLLQEGLTNVVRHAQAKAVQVTLGVVDEQLVLTVEDDGVGLAVEPKATSFGLVGMRERATTWGGTVTVGPRPVGGVAMTARLPLSRILRKAGG